MKLLKEIGLIVLLLLCAAGFGIYILSQVGRP